MLTFLSGQLPADYTSAGTLRPMTIFVTSGVDWAGGIRAGQAWWARREQPAGTRVEQAWPRPGVVQDRRVSLIRGMTFLS